MWIFPSAGFIWLFYQQSCHCSTSLACLYTIDLYRDLCALHVFLLVVKRFESLFLLLALALLLFLSLLLLLLLRNWVPQEAAILIFSFSMKSRKGLACNVSSATHAGLDRDVTDTDCPAKMAALTVLSSRHTIFSSEKQDETIRWKTAKWLFVSLHFLTI